MIYYQSNAVLTPNQLDTLYSSVGYATCTEDLDKLTRALSKSLIVITAWHNTTPVGLIRAVGDGETILYIQEILVDPSNQNKGIGTQLLTEVLDAYPDAEQHVLLKEATLTLGNFYDSLGFVPYNDGKELVLYQLN
ncbi:GNAT family N-acetyltransferase [Vagococcus sp. PNs007]|uniref:GNAT family N-acetyltransferase n=1 Tax=Vagococcus proximus TaxID=2991417 RepID=A0ABT5X2W0_9ENTE|nr:GNAT family N-acetyltransferase [Vagococcus proximus]MDF0480206.1 GNAT family N-acetyltransferase [Vagococcus proximus]